MLRISLSCTLFSLLLIISCKKETGETKYCWQLVDNLGNDLNIVCDKTEQELLDCTANGTCGVYNGGIHDCNYYRVDEPTFCWIIASRYYSSLSEKYVNCWFQAVPHKKVDCDTTCANYYTRRKMTYKPNNAVTYSVISPLRPFCGDTAAIFKSEIEFIIKNTADSLVLLQYCPDGINWH